MALNCMHMAYCNQDQVTAKNIIEINHCYIGRYECSFGENSCCYLSAGDLSIGSAMKKKSFSTFPLNHYHGISIIINLEKLLPEVRQIMELLKDLKEKKGLSFIFICHNLALVQMFCDRVLVLYEGKVVESGIPDDIINEPKEEYTRRLVDAVLS